MSRVAFRRQVRATTVESSVYPHVSRLATHTPLQMARVNAVLRSILEDFDQALEVSLGAPLAVYGLVPHTAEDRPVAAVAYVARALGVPESDVLLAAGIKERTFHDWKAHDRTPRLASQGRLWALVQVVEDLKQEIADLPSWFLSQPLRRDLLRGGRFDALMQSSAPDFLGPHEASGYGIGPELTAPAAPFLSAGLKRGTTTQRRMTKRGEGLK